MEMDAQFLFQVGAVVASLSGAWALVRAQVNTLKTTQEEIKSAVDEVNRELDDTENNVAVLRQQIKVLSDILSPDNLAAEHKRKGQVQEQIKSLQKDVITLQHMHNGRHPFVDELTSSHHAPHHHPHQRTMNTLETS
jgi:septal ring factor EnvC (AmiA/AmiB activator)